MTDAPIRRFTILVVDDHEVVRQGLVSMLDRRPNFRVGRGRDVAESIEAALARASISSSWTSGCLTTGNEACREIRAELPRRVRMPTSYPTRRPSSAHRRRRRRAATVTAGAVPVDPRGGALPLELAGESLCRPGVTGGPRADAPDRLGRAELERPDPAGAQDPLALVARQDRAGEIARRPSPAGQDGRRPRTSSILAGSTSTPPGGERPISRLGRRATVD
jgi:hypothetical protein